MSEQQKQQDDTPLGRLERIETKLNDVRETMAELRAIWPSLAKRVDRLETEMYGNGKVGLISKLNGLLWLGASAIPLVTAILAYLILGKAAL